MGHILNQWDYLVIVMNKEYYHNRYTANIPYLLKPGDMLYECHYEGRGYWYRGRIEEVGENGILLLDMIRGKQILLQFQHEPKDYIKQPEARRLIICPFPPFKKKPDLMRIDKLNERSFGRHPYSMGRVQVEDYISNLQNIGIQQISLFKQVKQCQRYVLP